MLQIQEGMMESYLRFVRERHNIWELRQAGVPGPWTEDPILQTRKFTNVFRVLDYGTQFLLSDLWDPWTDDPVDNLYRFFLYRHTGRWEAWQMFFLVHGRMPQPDEPELVFATFDQYRKDVGTIFTDAYLVFPQSQTKGTDKLQSIIDLADRLRQTGILQAYTRLDSVEARVALLRAQKGVGDFMAMQVTTDWGYICGGDENAYILAGPGARRGADYVAPGARAEDTIYWLQNTLNTELMKRGEAPVELEVAPGVFREPSLMDIQNTFCEFSKYVRFGERGNLPTEPYRAKHPRFTQHMFPSEWGER